MAIVRAVKTGVWSDVTVWNTGALPTAADDVYSNNFTVTINVSPTVLQISNASTTGVTAGGVFVMNTNGTTLTANVNAGSGPTALSSSIGTPNAINIVGNISGGGGNSACFAFSGSGTVNITGNVSAGFTGNSGCNGLNNTGNGTVNITGNVTAGGTGTNLGLNNTSGVVNVTGVITGSATNGGAPGLQNSGTLTHIGTVQAGAAAAGVAGGGTTILTGPFLTTSGGLNPVTATRWFWQNTSPPATYYQIRSANLAVIRPLYTADSVGGNPAIANVRSGTVYGPSSELTGTCAVPAAGSVALGVPVDNTTGTAAITAANIRSAIGLASANLDTQLAAIPTTAAPTAAANATAVRSELTTELGRIDASVSSRLAPGGTLARVTLADTTTTLTNAPSVPSAAQIATQVRTELTTELGRIDAAVSSRLAPAGTLARVTLTDTATTLTNAPTVPTAEQIANEVRTELTPELERVANCATVETTGDQIAALI